MEGSGRAQIQHEIRQAISALQLAQEILTGLTESDSSTTITLIQERASAMGAWLTGAELGAVSRFLGGESPEEIANEQGLSARTVDNQIRSGCRKLGFRDRREMKGWWTAASGYILTNPPQYRQERNGEETA